MLRGGNLVVTAAFSVMFLGRKLHRHHWFGIGLVVFGTAGVGMVSTFYPDNSGTTAG